LLGSCAGADGEALPERDPKRLGGLASMGLWCTDLLG
jgi:hypothetical protein